MGGQDFVKPRISPMPTTGRLTRPIDRPICEGMAKYLGILSVVGLLAAAGQASALQSARSTPLCDCDKTDGDCEKKKDKSEAPLCGDEDKDEDEGKKKDKSLAPLCGGDDKKDEDEGKKDKS